MYGTQTGTFYIVDLKPLLDQKILVDPSYNDVKSIFLRNQETISIGRLSGFEKGFHSAPTRISAAARKFFENKSAAEVQEK